MKSAYERALEKLEAEGIDRPRADLLTPEIKDQVATVRRKAEARIAELEIMFRKQLTQAHDPAERERISNNHQAECRRIEEDRERKIEQLRQG